ncbi:hypothetical protein JIG36_10650 [Actinoplanes sp. LDG1-06]|uniref:Uncharacterized protein n=1 Tax=Paractinoplanes ovalisporus TaxID=2810368 RepID=A0ABS2A865_9ACTN|nr:hypothetical protein [Actinoplanes ovalisporus]MBM2616015.1 hypothetical protein [Actinoplanes ovalisporus]
MWDFLSDLFGALSNGPGYFLVVGSILCGVTAFLRNAHNKGIDGWDVMLILGLVGASAIYCFVVLLVLSHPHP